MSAVHFSTSEKNSVLLIYKLSFYKNLRTKSEIPELNNNTFKHEGSRTVVVKASGAVLH